MLVRLEGDGPLHRRLTRGLRAAILDGRLPARARLPSTRALAAELGVSRNVVLLAFEQLLAEGYAVATVGSGTYVSPTLPDAIAPLRPGPSAPPRLSRHARRIVALRPLPPPGSSPAPGTVRHDFRYGVPSAEDFPHATWCRLVGRRARGMSL